VVPELSFCCFFGALGIDVAMANSPPVECWLSKNQELNSLWMYIPIFVSFFISIVLLIYGIFKVRSFPDPKVFRRMMAFICAFLLIWLVPVVDRLRFVIKSTSPPPAVAFIHWASIALSGFANAIIWVSTTVPSNPRAPPTKTTEGITNQESVEEEDNDTVGVQWSLLPNSPSDLDEKLKIDDRASSPIAHSGFTPNDQLLRQHLQNQKIIMVKILI